MTTLLASSRMNFTVVAEDLYRDIHKGIRTELFAVTTEAGRVDPGDRQARAVLADRIRAMTELLLSHAEHEDKAIQPALEIHFPELAITVETEHAAIDARMLDLVAMATAVVDAEPSEQRPAVHRLYLELASFTAAYLQHQDVEERVIMPALHVAIGAEAVLAIHVSIVSNIPPDEMAQALALMLPVMNIDDRAELLGGVRATAPAPVFEGVWGLAGSVLTAADHAALASRLGLV